MELGWSNFLQYGINLAVGGGVSEGTILLVLLFPLVTALVAAFRHVVGLNGFGLFVPSIVAMALVSVGWTGGVGLLVVTIIVASVARMITRRLKLQYLPRMSLVFWLVSLGVAAGLVGGGSLGWAEVGRVGIFPILVFMLLAENFIEVQMSKSQREAVVTTVETVVMAAGAAWVVGLEWVQLVVLQYPEIYMLVVAGINIFVGKYTGLRLLEWWKFRGLWQK